MDIRQINEEYAVTGQISVEDLATIKSMGFKSVVCHRPDHETPDQPDFADIRAAAEALSLEIRQIPVAATGLTADNVAAMNDALDEMPRPMLGFCRSGNRSSVIYQQTLHMRG